MKYAVIGLGAVGTIVGGILKKAGEDVVLIGKKNQIDIINQNGLKINGINGSLIIKDVNASSDFSSIEESDIIIICVKSYDTKTVANQIKKHLKKAALIISFQNGIRNSDLLKKITGNEVISGIILFNSLFTKPGEVTLSIKGGLLIENNNSYPSEIDNLINSFRKKGLSSITAERIEGFLWSKLIVNLQNAVSTLTNQSIKDSIVNFDSRSILIATMKEGLYVLEKSGISIDTLPDMDPKKMIYRLSNYNSIFLRIGSRFMGLKNARTSMWQSISRGRSTEIDYINGEIVSLAKKNNLHAPINEKIVELIKKTESEQLKKYYEPSELRKILKV
jgi:2-dehydropantoate 2-reductase